MGFFNFNLITDPPNDEFVNEDTQLNQNLDKLDTKLALFPALPTVITPLVMGTEVLNDSDPFPSPAVWDGTGWRYMDNDDEDFDLWQSLPLIAPITGRTGIMPRYRVNTVIRKVELAGGVLATAAAAAWSRTKVQITANTGGILDAYKPVGTQSIQQVATGAGTAAGQFASARITIEGNAGNSVKISVSYQGDNVNGNFVQLDGAGWYF